MCASACAPHVRTATSTTCGKTQVKLAAVKAAKAAEKAKLDARIEAARERAIACCRTVGGSWSTTTSHAQAVEPTKVVVGEDGSSVSTCARRDLRGPRSALRLAWRSARAARRSSRVDILRRTVSGRRVDRSSGGVAVCAARARGGPTHARAAARGHDGVPSVQY